MSYFPAADANTVWIYSLLVFQAYFNGGGNNELRGIE